MKKLLLTLTLAFTFVAVHAQCTPDPQYVLPGTYPTIGLADGFVGQAYNEVITVITPLDTTILISGILLPVTIIDISLDSVIGLPANFTYSCDPLNCSFPGGSSGCVSIFSTSNLTVADTGLYHLYFYTTTTVDAGFAGIQTQNDVIDHYYIEILNNTNILGCTDPTALNYDPTATIDDGSCFYCNLTVSVTTTDIMCYGACDGTAQFTATGGTPPYSYSWSNGQTTPTIANLCAGTYWVDIADGNGCLTMSLVTIIEPDSLSISIDSTDETSALNDGLATATVLGGTFPYTYSWNTTPPQTTNPATNLGPGLYTVNVTDANGCIISDATSVNAYNPTGVINIKNTSKTLIKVTDVLGQETPYRRNTPLFYIYDDGTVEKRIIVE